MHSDCFIFSISPTPPPPQTICRVKCQSWTSVYHIRWRQFPEDTIVINVADILDVTPWFYSAFAVHRSFGRWYSLYSKNRCGKCFIFPLKNAYVCRVKCQSWNSVYHIRWHQVPEDIIVIKLFGAGIIIFLILVHPVYKMWLIQEPNT